MSHARIAAVGRLRQEQESWFDLQTLQVLDVNLRDKWFAGVGTFVQRIVDKKKDLFCIVLIF